MQSRYEIKFCCEELAHADVLSELRLRAGIRELHPSRTVQSIYFDTHAGRALQANLAGISTREKFRFRWYGEGTDFATGQLERKMRENTLGHKVVTAIPDPVQIHGQERQAFVQQLVAQLTSTSALHLTSGLEPVQWIRYHREYYTTPDGRVRITMDRELVSYDLRYRSHLDQIDRTVPSQILVVEYKADKDQYSALSELVQKTSLRADRCSKFVLASAPQHGPVPSRRF